MEESLIVKIKHLFADTLPLLAKVVVSVVKRACILPVFVSSAWYQARHKVDT
jgi:hypothetical protein